MQSLYAFSKPSTGKSLCSILGKNLPTDPGKLYIGVLTDTTGEASVIP